MQKTISTLLIFILLFLGALSAQERKRSCGIIEHMHFLGQSNPGVYRDIDNTDEFIQRQREVRREFPQTLVDQVRVIPVVVHIIFKTSEQNISDPQIHSQLRVLNEDFQRKANTRGHNTHPSGANTNIEFRLAQVDPNGNSTTGITRTQTNTTSFSADDAMKFDSRGGKDAWDTTRYVNMWVANLGDDLLGYAQFPGGPEDTDGVVMLFSSFGDTGQVRPPFHLGRTTTHEVGHYLGLRHIWGDGPCFVDDGINDTPRSDSPNFGSPQHPLIKCGQDNMFENYMDYSDDGAMNIFTRDQSEKMNATLDTFRSGLINGAVFSSN